MAAVETYVKLPFGFVTPGEILAAGIVLPVLGILLVGLRFYTRILQKSFIGIDDWLTLPALVSSCYSPFRVHFTPLLTI